VYHGYWEDVGTIPSYFQANLALCQPVPPFDFYDATRPVFTNSRFLPASKLEQCSVQNSLISEGCIVQGATIDRAIIGIRSRIGKNACIRNSLLLGADEYETLSEIVAAEYRGVPPIGIGADSVIEGAIVDKSARIGRGVRIVNQTGIFNHDGNGYYIREGIIVIPKNGVIVDGTVI
jgi:glucose-1-phosphate adenylyltransferase